jgi:beta-N-acetylhexosaminidase
MDLSPGLASTASVTPEATPTVSFRVGDTVSVRTNIILDHNGHPVPDGTGVRFNISLSREGGVVQQIDAVTIQGLAGASFSIDRPGLLEIRAESDPALTSVVLQLDVSGEGVSVAVFTPTPNIGTTPTPEATVTPEVEPDSPLVKGYPGLGSWFGMMLILGGLSAIAYFFGKRYVATLWGVRWALCIVAGGLVAYTYLAVRLPGAADYLQRRGWMGMMGVVVLGAVVGFGSAYIWLRLSTGSPRQSD